MVVGNLRRKLAAAVSGGGRRRAEFERAKKEAQEQARREAREEFRQDVQAREKQRFKKKERKKLRRKQPVTALLRGAVAGARSGGGGGGGGGGGAGGGRKRQVRQQRGRQSMTGAAAAEVDQAFGFDTDDDGKTDEWILAMDRDGNGRVEQDEWYELKDPTDRVDKPVGTLLSGGVGRRRRKRKSLDDAIREVNESVSPGSSEGSLAEDLEKLNEPLFDEDDLDLF